jgi:hypothetical protein
VALRKGFKCQACGKYERFALYVYAHWDEVLTYTCDCGQAYSIQAGSVARIGATKKKVSTKKGK